MTAVSSVLPRPGDSPAPADSSQPTAPTPRSRRFRPDIEGLRAVAVVSVVLYHARLGVPGGYVGVDVFFVISGFLITRQLTGSVGRRRPGAIRKFYSRRIRRLLPAAALVVVTTVLAMRVWGPPLEVRTTATDALFTTFYGLNYRLAIQGTEYLHQGDAASPLQHFWSLAVEEQFYVFWPLLILLVAVLAGRRRTGVLVTLLVAVIAVSYRLSIETTAHDAPLAYFSLQTRAWELALGALVGVGAGLLARMPAALGELGAAVGLLAVLGSCFALNNATAYPGAIAAVPVGGAALVIACGTASRRRIERVLGEALMQCLGRVSYSWYLWHWPMLIVGPYVVGHALGVAQRLFVVWLSLVAAVVSYFTVEDPARRLHLGRRSSTAPWFGVGALLSGAVVAACVLVIANPPSLVGSGADRHLRTVQAGAADPAARARFLAQVRSAVAQGMTTVAAPANLTPQPAHAAGDVPDPSKVGCHLELLQTTQGACVFGDPHASRTVVLFGDSHMEQWEPAYAIVAEQLHWRIVSWTKSGCPAASLSVFSPTLNRAYSECDRWRSATIARIAALRPTLVIAGESENTQGVTPISDRRWTQATLTTLRELHARTAAPVDFMGDTPFPREPEPDCVADHLGNVRPCGTDLEHAYTYPGRHRLVNASVARAGFRVIDPQPWLCAPAGCPSVVGNLLVYRDSSHVSVEYASYLSPLLTSVLAVQ